MMEKVGNQGLWSCRRLFSAYLLLTVLWSVNFVVATASSMEVEESCSVGLVRLENALTRGDRDGSPSLRREIGAFVESCGGEVDVKMLVEDYYRRYLNEAQDKFAVHLLHLSKTGGTTMCNLAKHHGCQVREKEDKEKAGNCWCEVCLDGPRWMESEREEKRYQDRFWVDSGEYRAAPHASCHARSQIMLRSGLTMLANENFMLGGVRSPHRVAVCPQFLNIIVLRDPTERIVSHIFELARAHYQSDPQPFDVVQTIYPRVLDNYMLRSLLGGFAFRRPAGMLTLEDLRLGLDILESFDVVMVTEQLNDEKYNRAFLELAIGWDSATLSKTSQNSAARIRRWGSNVTIYSPEEMNTIRRLNDLDKKLYERAVELSHLDFAVYSKLQAFSHWALPDNSSCQYSCGHVCQT